MSGMYDRSGSNGYPNNVIPGTASLLEDLDKRLMVALRDDRILIGFLRLIDQFGNLVLHRTVERIYVRDCYGDIERGIFIVRGENVLLLGEVNENLNLEQAGLRKLTETDILLMQFEENQRKKDEEDRKRKAMISLGLIPHLDNQFDDQF